MIENLNLPSKNYNVILMVDTFRHLIEPLKTLKECARLCKKNGVIVIRDLNINHGDSRKRFSASQEWDLQCLSPKTAKLFMEKAGIKNVHFFPSPMSLLTIPLIKKISKTNPKISNKLMTSFNELVRMVYNFSFRRWLSITPEMLIIGEK
jgi:ubiquinone/menaquinone biosynthesis C-methylase UbiE